MAVLRSYVSGRWTSPADGRPVRDAVTGEEVARVSADGIDIAAALEYGRRTGGPALRALTFHERAALRQGCRHHAARAPEGAVRAVGADRRHPGRREVRRRRRASACCSATPARPGASCPTTRSTSRAPVEPLGQGGQFVGQHILTPAARRRRPDQRLQLPGLGPAGEARPGVARRRARAGQAGHPDRVPDRPAGRADRRVRPAARRRAAAGLRQRGGPARPPDRAGPRSASPARRRPPGSCARTRTWWPARSGSTPRPTR